MRFGLAKLESDILSEWGYYIVSVSRTNIQVIKMSKIEITLNPTEIKVQWRKYKYSFVRSRSYICCLMKLLSQGDEATFINR